MGNGTLNPSGAILVDEEKYVEAVPFVSVGLGGTISMPCTGVNEMDDAVPAKVDLLDLIVVKPPCWRRDSSVFCSFWDILKGAGVDPI